MSEPYPFFFTWAAQKDAHGFALTGGDGSFFVADDSRWLDMGSMSYQASLGHSSAEVVAAITEQAGALCVSAPRAIFPAKVELAQHLLRLAPDGFSKVFFTSGGAEATENALKVARLVTGRHKTISRYRSYHGATMGALSLTGDWRRPPLEPGLPGAVHALDCHCDRCPFGQRLDSCRRECAHHISDLLALEGAGTVGAVVLEAIPGANGVLIPPKEYWPVVREACTKDGALLVADEVLTGFGRTGRCFAFEHYDVVPDMITVGKALTAGYGTLGAVLVHERVAKHFDDNVLSCGLTGYAHPLACAAANASLRVYEQDDLFARSATLGASLGKQLAAIQAARPDRVHSVRGLGLLWAVDLVASDAEWAALRAALAAQQVHVHMETRQQDRYVVLAPPLNIEESDLALGVSKIRDAIEDALPAQEKTS